ncbi:hypothetical protein OIU74_025492 [Salix koriyanagi]|uniref:Uncharacterized protein n=1 Tax=Salix koriyanagi TaxID=2511006 RepID=A0A9Q0W2J1_9ROSI|nr:hypothetical protein OIU74_025492 [Salix koriyanagi]
MSREIVQVINVAHWITTVIERYLILVLDDDNVLECSSLGQLLSDSTSASQSWCSFSNATFKAVGGCSIYVKAVRPTRCTSASCKQKVFSAKLLSRIEGSTTKVKACYWPIPGSCICIRGILQL